MRDDGALQSVYESHIEFTDFDSNTHKTLKDYSKSGPNTQINDSLNYLPPIDFEADFVIPSENSSLILLANKQGEILVVEAKFSNILASYNLHSDNQEIVKQTSKSKLENVNLFN